MSHQFFEKPILNSPYEIPTQHWELDKSGQPTNQLTKSRRPAEFISPIPKPRKRKFNQGELLAEQDISNNSQTYATSLFINSVREKVSEWRKIVNPEKWQVSPETARLLQHWRHYDFHGVRPFFCQLEAVETAIWLAEVAPLSKQGQNFIEQITTANKDANPEIWRVALKLATGAGKTTVMAMLIAWQTINAARHSSSKKFTRGFLVVTPGITIKDRLQILQPNHPDNYYSNRELVPSDMLGDIARAKIVITNYHAFKLRERLEISSGTRKLIQGRGEPLQTLETEGQMLQRVMPDLMGMKNVLVINDEAHHCYREKPDNDEIDDLKGDEKDEAKKNNEAARLWISGIEIVKRKLGVDKVYDLSATPFFLRGSGYAEGTLFPWTVSDFSLMDAIECGIVKLPRVPISDNALDDMPKLRNLWEHIRTKMPKKGRGAAGKLDPLKLPPDLQTALEALYGHYEKTYHQWQETGIRVPPVFIVVCNNTSTSKLVYDFISGFERENEDGSITPNNGHFELFRNYDDNCDRLARPRTLLIDSEQLESGDALDGNFREMAAPEIDRFRRDLAEREGSAVLENVTDQDLLREVMNTVGKEGKLGESIRCVVSVSMLTEGWDTNTVTHVLGVRAFGTQLLCEQVIGRALRRYSYELNDEGLFDVEYADVLGIPFDFTAKPVIAKSKPPKNTVHVEAVKPDRDELEIKFPRVEGYRVELPDEKLTAVFNEDSLLEINPILVGPSITNNQGIIGEAVELNLKHLDGMRQSTILFHLTKRLLYTKYRDANEEPKLHLFGQLKRIVKQWIDRGYLRCTGNTFPAQVLYLEIADMACNRIKDAIESVPDNGDRPIQAVLDAYNPIGSTAHVRFNTSKQTLWKTAPNKSHVNWVVCDGNWEAEFCRVVEAHPRVRSYVKNQGLGFEVPYLYGSTQRKYIPDFIVQIDDGRDDLLNLIVEIKGFRGEDAKDKANTMKTYWIPGVNNLGKFGRWQFAEFTEVFEIDSGFHKLIETLIL
ncbi:MAG: DEAD/DEAH box helicase family protein [Pseudanabaena sp. LacPavin_0818_WC45_MAG_42_6]|nr:DEAD/DEAH box helicase family protein [Pseudanabaena sp. LacPavin_0818_WC45_MAG_42_6]